LPLELDTSAAVSTIAIRNTLIGSSCQINWRKESFTAVPRWALGLLSVETETAAQSAGIRGCVIREQWPNHYRLYVGGTTKPYSVTCTLPEAICAKFMRRLSASVLATVREAVGKLSSMRDEWSRFWISTSSEFPFFMMTRECETF
jgi:hypothetical protein